MEQKDRLKSIFDYILKSSNTPFRVGINKLQFVSAKNGDLVGYTFILKTSQEYDGIEIDQMFSDLKETEETMSSIFSKNIINKEYKLSDSKNYPNLWVGTLLYSLNANHRDAIMEAEWEIYVELND